MCVSLIQANIFTLGQILQLLLQSFMTLVTSPQDSADSAGVLQLFLETYFTEQLGEDAEMSIDADQEQVPGPSILRAWPACWGAHSCLKRGTFDW